MTHFLINYSQRKFFFAFLRGLQTLVAFVTELKSLFPFTFFPRRQVLQPVVWGRCMSRAARR
jgi:hypothetical protein